MSAGVIAGVAIGSIAGAVLIFLVAFWLIRRCRRRRRQTLVDPWGHSAVSGATGAIQATAHFEPKKDIVITSLPADTTNTQDRSLGASHSNLEEGKRQSYKDDIDVDLLPVKFFGPLNADHDRILYPNLQKGDIRVLEIMEGKDNEDIICKLWLHTIEPQPDVKITRHRTWPSYEALSYVWGQKPRNPKIKAKKAKITVINPDAPGVQAKFVIGWNLNEALKFFRQRNCSRILWTDQICINQDENNPEKMTQVLKMKDIYVHANQVQVWLGPRIPESERAAKYFAPFDSKAFTDDDLMQSYRSAPQRWEDLFDGFQIRPWWTRAWIVQEVMCSPNPMLNSGPDALSLNLILILMKFVSRKGINLVTSNSKVGPTTRSPPLEMAFMRERMKSFGMPHLLEWLSTFHNQIATDPRDRVFAYLGLATHAFPYPPQTTYTDKIEDVWAEATKLALYMSNNLDFICVGRARDYGVPGMKRDDTPPNPEDGDRPLEGPLNLPSWVPNFRVNEGNGVTSARTLPLAYHPRAASAYNACGRLRCGAFTEGWKELEVLGIFVDKIKHTSKINFGAADGADAEKFLSDVFRLFRDVVGQCRETCTEESCTHYPGPRGGSYIMAMWKTPVMDLDFHSRRLRPEYGFHTLHHRLDEAPASFKPAVTDKELRRALWNEHLYDEKSRWSNYRRFVVTENGYLGMATADCQVGDSIYIMGGATIPFVMRETRSTSTEGYKSLTFVGERYVTTLQLSHRMDN